MLVDLPCRAEVKLGGRDGAEPDRTDTEDESVPLPGRRRGLERRPRHP